MSQLPEGVERLLSEMVNEFEDAFHPLLVAGRDPVALNRFLHQIGWDVEPLLGTEPGTLVASIEDLYEAFQSALALAKGAPTIDEIGPAVIRALEALRDFSVQAEGVLEGIVQFGASSPEHQIRLMSALVRDAGEHLLLRYVAKRAPLVLAVARLVGFMGPRQVAALYAAENQTSGQPIRFPILRMGINDRAMSNAIMLPVRAVVDNLGPEAFRSIDAFFFGVRGALARMMAPVLPYLDPRRVTEIAVVITLDGISIEVPGVFPAIEGIDQARGFPIPLKRAASQVIREANIEPADFPVLVVKTAGLELNWSSTSSADEVMLIDGLLYLTDTFHGTAIQNLGIQFHLNVVNPENPRAELSLASALRLVAGDVTNHIGLKLSAAMDSSAAFSLEALAEAVPDLILPIAFPGLDGMALVVGQPVIRVSFTGGDDPQLRIILEAGAFGIRLPTESARKATRVGNDWQLEEGAPEIRFSLANNEPGPLVDVKVGATGAGASATPAALSIAKLSLIEPDDGTSVRVTSDAIVIGFDSPQQGFIIDVDGFDWQFSDGSDLTGGISIEKAVVHFPAVLEVLDSIEIRDARIDDRGFSGAVSVLFDENASSESDAPLVGEGPESVKPEPLFGVLSIQLYSLYLEFLDNFPVAFDLKAAIKLPYFNEWVDLTIGIDDRFNIVFKLESTAPEGIVLTKEELLSITVRSAEFEYFHDTRLLRLSMSGGLEPLLWNADGLEWPELDITNLVMEQDLSVLPPAPIEPPIFKFKEAWLNLTELKPLDLWGFKFELNRVGLGFEDARDRLWVDLSGSVRLLPQIPVGLGVEGFRLSWPRDLSALFTPEHSATDLALAVSEQLEVKFDGVYLYYAIPDAVEFEGFIRFIKEAQKVGFAGDIALRVPATGFGAEAGLMVGMNFAAPPYPFLYVYFGVDLPAGIPLGQSGLALKGALGLFGLNVAPDKTPEQNWYYDWYKRGPVVGAHPTNKWRDERMAAALGVGVTITTVDGYIKGTRGLLVLALPGPILVIEGRALILDGLLPAEPPLRALAVFDGREQTVQFNIEAEAELVADMLAAYGMLEAFFDFKDLANWHLYLGQDTPADRRIRANVFKFDGRFLFDANAYLMLDMVGQHTLRSRLGVFIGFQPEIPPLDPVTVKIDGTLEGDGVVTMLPEQFSGDVALSANVEVSAFGFGIQLAANADVLSEGPNPFTVDANLAIQADLPAPLDPFTTTLHFNWESPSTPEINPPLVAAVADSNYASGGGALRLVAQGDLSAQNRQALAESSPVVPLDARSTLAFGHDMNDDSDNGFRRDSSGEAEFYSAGLMRFTPTLRVVRLYEHRKKLAWSAGSTAETAKDDGNWTLVASTVASEVAGDVKPLWGTWLADVAPEDPSAPAARRLRLWTDNPFVHSQGALGVGYQRILGMPGLRKPYIESFLAAYPDYWKCNRNTAQDTCIDFVKAVSEKPKSLPWMYHSVIFDGEGVAEIKQIQQAALVSQPNVSRLRASLDWIRARFRPPAVTHTCLILHGSWHHLRFPEPVRRVRIHFCKPPKPPVQEAAPHIRTLRRAHTAAELDALKKEAQAKGNQPDFTACVHSVPHRQDVTGQVWTIETDKSFLCLEFRLEDPAIHKICYLTEAELVRAAQAKRQCEINNKPIGSEELLRPGSYYLLEVESALETELPLTSDPVLNLLYQNAFAGLPGFEAVDDGNPLRGRRTYVQEAFFQTEGPPHNLARYVKWSTPASQAVRIFRGNDFSIRFLRSTMQEMYDREAHYLKILLRDAQSAIVDSYETKWSQAGSATLLPEEQTWLAHRQGTELSQPLIDPDDVLEAQLKEGSAPLEPKARYELLVTGGEGGALLFMDDFAADSLQPAWQPSEAGWSVAGSELKPAPGGGIIIAGDAKWSDVDLTIEIKGESGATVGVVFRYQPNDSGSAQYYRYVMQPARMVLERVTGAGQPKVLAERRQVYPQGRWLRVRVAVVADQVRIWLFDDLILETTLRFGRNDESSGIFFQGQVGLYATSDRARFRRLRVHEAVLYRVPFTTSAFNSFRDLVRSYPDKSNTVRSKRQDTAPIPVQSSQTLATALAAWEQAQVNFRDEKLDRAGLEEAKLALREARAIHDETFRRLCEEVADLYYQAFAPHMEIFNLEAQDGSLTGFWVRSPETLDLWQDLVDSSGTPIGHVGRTRLALKTKSETGDWEDLKFSVSHDSDSTQLLLFPVEVDTRPWSKGTYQLTFIYRRNHDDENSDIDHRYDRPVEKHRGTDQTEAAGLEWVVT